MKTSVRLDHGALRKPEITPQGFLKADAQVARVGVLVYRNPDGSLRRELRLPEEVSRADSLAAFEGISITDGHPTVLVSADNVRTLEAGTVTGVARMDGDWVVAPIVVKDKKLIAKIMRGETGVSVGYTIREDWTPGVHPVYGAYDLIQRNIGPNHLAGAVPVPRAGDGARIRMDGADVAVEYRADFGAKLTSVISGHQHLIDTSGARYGSPGDGQSGCTSWAVSEGADVGHEHAWIRNADGSLTIAMAEGHTHEILDENRYSAPAPRADAAHQIDRSRTVREVGGTMKTREQLEEELRLLQVKLTEVTTRADQADADLKIRTDERDSARGELATAKKLVEDTQARLDSGLAVAETEEVKKVQARLDEANEKIVELEKSIPTQVRARVQLVTRAQAILGNEYRADSLDDKTILEAGIRRFDPKADLAKESLVGLRARFDAFYEARANTVASNAAAGAALAVRTDKQEPTEPDPFDPLNNGVGQFASPHAAKKGA